MKSFYEGHIKSKAPSNERLFEPVMESFARLLMDAQASKGKRALDLGYGYGNYSLAMAEQGWSVVAVDFISKEYLQERIKGASLVGNIEILEADLGTFAPEGTYDLVVAKDVLHFLSSSRVLSLIKELVALTETGGIHYLVIFTDIVRVNDDGQPIILDGEAGFSSDALAEELRTAYAGWDLEIVKEEYKEKSRRNPDKFYFQSNRLTITARNI